MVGNLFSVITPTADIQAAPHATQSISNNDSQLLFGESFNVIGAEGEWLRGVSMVDDYEGFIHVSKIAPQAAEPTHFVDVKLTHIYPMPDFKSHPIKSLSMLSRLAPEGASENGFVRAGKGWIFEAHIKPIQEMQQTAPLDTALAFTGTPYLYGGRSALGIDCSGLVQIALMRAGHTCLRDSGPQSKTIGSAIEGRNFKAGDFIFFKGHVGIMVDQDRILNATARTMDTRIETLDTLIDFYGEITAARRL